MKTTKEKLIGKGAFTEVYLQPCGKRVRYETEDLTKICLAEWCDYNRFLPVITKEWTANNDTWYLTAPLYLKVKAPKKQLKPLHYTYYLWLRNNLDGVKDYEALHIKLNTCPYKPLKECLTVVVDDMCNYLSCDYLAFEISPRNIMTDSRGNLILMDVFYSMEQLRKIRNK